MKRIMATLALCLFAGLGIHPALAQDHWYWTLDPGNTKTYVNTENSQDLVFQLSDGEAYDATIWWSRHVIEGSLVNAAALLLSLDTKGNVWLHGWYDPLSLPDAPFIMIEAPLEVGTTWDEWMMWDTGNLLHHVEEVLEAGYVDIPFNRSTYFCYRVKLSIYIDGQLRAIADRWINDGMGIVKYNITEYGDTPIFIGWGLGEYVLAEGVVPVEATTWGLVKVMYR